MKVLKKYKLLILYVYLTIWTALASTPLNEVFEFPLGMNRIFSLLLYFPFLLIIIWKLISDIKSFNKTAVNIIYYAFAAYYGILTAVRFFMGMQVKESIYYTVVLLGSIALYTQLRYKHVRIENEDYSANLYAIIIYTVVYKWIFSILATGMFGVPRVLSHPPINNLYSTSVIVMLLPFIIDGFRNADKKKNIWRLALLTVALILVVICNSRGIIVLALGIVGVLALINIKNGKLFLRIATSAVCMLLIICTMAITNVATIRYSLYRATGISIVGLTETESNTDLIDDGFEEDALEQAGRSDAMRSDLMKLGVEEIKKNFVFGTGDLYYTYDMGYKFMEQTAHNFVLESMVCYGIIGTAMIAAQIIAILIECGFFKKKLGVPWQVRISAFAVLGYYFAFGMVQPSVYNAILCPTFYMILAYYGAVLSGSNDKVLPIAESKRD